jgi:hypothetical protein
MGSSDVSMVYWFLFVLCPRVSVSSYLISTAFIVVESALNVASGETCHSWEGPNDSKVNSCHAF